MKKSVFISIRLLAVFTVITGMIYPLLITGASLLFFHDKAEGSLVKTDGRVVGSELIGQQTENPRYFHSRPSAVDYQAIPSGASNLSWSDKRLKELVQLRKEAFLSENFLPDTTAIPQEMLFASASGIDPHISPRAAYLQVKRIALSRDFTDEQTLQLNELIMNLEEGPQFSVFGEQRINVFLLNLELDKIK